MKEDNPITDAIKVDVTNTEDNAKIGRAHV